MSKLDLLQGTLDLMVLKTLAAMGQLHGYGIARRIEQVSGNKCCSTKARSTRLSCALNRRLDRIQLGRVY